MSSAIFLFLLFFLGVWVVWLKQKKTKNPKRKEPKISVSLSELSSVEQKRKQSIVEHPPEITPHVVPNAIFPSEILVTAEATFPSEVLVIAEKSMPYASTTNSPSIEPKQTFLEVHPNKLSSSQQPAFSPWQDYPEETLFVLATWIDCSVEELKTVCRQVFENKAFIPFQKRDASKQRWIVQLSPELLCLQKKILHRLLYKLPCSHFAHGAVTGRSIHTHLQQHKKSNEFFCLDVQDAFPSVRFSRIKKILKKGIKTYLKDSLSQKWGTSLEHVSSLSHLLTSLCTAPSIQKGKKVFTLPLGAPCSGYLFNLACLEMDGIFQKICEKHKSRKLVYSRYMDDILLSSHEPITEEIKKEAIHAILKANFKENPEKTKHWKASEDKQIYGFVFCNHQISLEPQKEKELLERAEFLAQKTSKQNTRKLLGILHFVKQVYDELPVAFRAFEKKQTKKEVQEVKEPSKDFFSDETSLLSDWLAIPEEELLSVLEKQRKNEAYSTWKLSKGNGTFRSIDAPCHELKALQTQILERLLYSVPVSIHAHGFVPHRSIVTNAKPHCGSRFVLNMDLKEAFPSIHPKRVFHVLERNLGSLLTHHGKIYSKETFRKSIQLLTKLVTWNNSLPQGAPTSGYLLNLVLIGLDGEISALAKSFPLLEYTRYADDLTFSSREEIPNEFGKHVQQLIRKKGLLWNNKKTSYRSVSKGQSLEVCGLLVDGEEPRIGKEKIRKYRSIFRQCLIQKESLQEDQIAQLNGIMGFVKMVNPVFSNTLYKPYLELLSKYPQLEKAISPEKENFVFPVYTEWKK